MEFSKDRDVFSYQVKLMHDNLLKMEKKLDKRYERKIDKVVLKHEMES